MECDLNTGTHIWRALSFFYHLGDIIYTISGRDAEGGEPVKPYSHSLWQCSLPSDEFPLPATFAVLPLGTNVPSTSIFVPNRYFH